MIFSLDLFSNAIVSGILLGGFYCAVAVGITIAFGMLDIVNIAHPAFIMAGGFIAYFFNTKFGIDPVLAGVVAAVPAYAAGRLLYRFYYSAFESRGEESLQGLAFFFGLLFIIEVGLMLIFGVDYRSVAAVGSMGHRDWKAEHDAIAEATLNRDVEQAVGTLMQHYSATSEILQETLDAHAASRAHRKHGKPARLRHLR